jgi:glycosyltransferase involved in cell wall biosynthesis
MKVTLLMPTLNEIDGMRAIMPRVKREWVDQILVADGHSTDGTVEYAREQGYDVIIQSRPGIRYAYLEAMPHVVGDVVITFSPDGNCVPEVIPELVAKMREGYDMVIASRYYQGLKSEDDDRITAFGNWFFRNLINVLHRAHYSDPMNIFRAWKKQLMYDLDLDKEESHAPERWFGTTVSIEPLLSIRVPKARLRYTEIAGPEPARIGGQRKLQIVRWGGTFLAQAIRELFYWTPPRKRST